MPMAPFRDHGACGRNVVDFTLADFCIRCSFLAALSGVVDSLHLSDCCATQPPHSFGADTMKEKRGSEESSADARAREPAASVEDSGPTSIR